MRAGAASFKCFITPRKDSSATPCARRELQRCVAKQFTADGGHIEACPTYHNVCVVLLARFLDLAAAAGQDLPSSVRRLAAATGEQTLHSVRPTGVIVPWGDSTRSNHIEAALWLYRTTGDASVLQHFAALAGPEGAVAAPGAAPGAPGAPAAAAPAAAAGAAPAAAPSKGGDAKGGAAKK